MYIAEDKWEIKWVAIASDTAQAEVGASDLDCWHGNGDISPRGARREYIPGSVPNNSDS
jgi:hypothetical protein